MADPSLIERLNSPAAKNVLDKELEAALSPSSASGAAGQSLAQVNSLVLDERLKDHRCVPR